VIVVGLVAVAASVLSSAALRAASTFDIVNLDGPAEGLNDASPFTPTDGNPATTLGGARLWAVETAARMWASMVDSEIPIRVGVTFDPLGTGETPALLGLGGAEAVFRDFGGAPVAETWYVSALADKWAGVDLDPGEVDLTLQFNSDVDGPVLFGEDGFDYGFDPQVPVGNVWFLDVALHELAHGLGFTTVVDFGTGAKLFGKDDAYLVHLLSEGASPERLAEMDDAARLAAIGSGNLQWGGPGTVAIAGAELTGGVTARGNVAMHSPATVSPLVSATHFAASVIPHQLLSAFYTDDPLATALTRAVVDDLGWGAAPPCEPVTLP
jgi:hypothetical protein